MDATKPEKVLWEVTLQGNTGAINTLLAAETFFVKAATRFEAENFARHRYRDNRTQEFQEELETAVARITVRCEALYPEEI